MDERRKREKVQEVEVSLLVESAKVCRKNSSFYFGGFATSIDFKVTLNNEFKLLLSTTRASRFNTIQKSFRKFFKPIFCYFLDSFESATLTIENKIFLMVSPSISRSTTSLNDWFLRALTQRTSDREKEREILRKEKERKCVRDKPEREKKFVFCAIFVHRPLARSLLWKGVALTSSSVARYLESDVSVTEMPRQFVLFNIRASLDVSASFSFSMCCPLCLLGLEKTKKFAFEDRRINWLHNLM